MQVKSSSKRDTEDEKQWKKMDLSENEALGVVTVCELELNNGIPTTYPCTIFCKRKTNCPM